jgi:hypothetical protein
MALIYISHPYTSLVPGKVEENVSNAIEQGIQVMSKGHSVLIPNLSHFIHLQALENGIDIPYEKWMEMDLDILNRCDAILYTKSSPGCDRELEHATQIGLHVYRSVAEIPHAPCP